jgi:hypothetical protein
MLSLPESSQVFDFLRYVFSADLSSIFSDIYNRQIIILAVQSYLLLTQNYSFFYELIAILNHFLPVIIKK